MSKRITFLATLVFVWASACRLLGGGIVLSCTESALTNALTGGGTVTFACSGTITVTSTKVIATDTVLDANGNSVLISGGDTVRVFLVNTNATLTMYGITICNGRFRNGAGLRNNGGTVEATDCVFRENQALGANGTTGAAGSNETIDQGGNGDPGGAGQDAFGAAIFNVAGTLRLLRCTFESNNATGGNGGAGGQGGQSQEYWGGDGGNGGIAGIAQGGAINTTGPAWITNCTFHGNSARGGNSGPGGLGGVGGLYPGYNGSPGASGASSGGALDGAATMFVIGCTFSANRSRGGSGGIGGHEDGTGDGQNGSVGGDSFGGGVCNASTARFINCTFEDNRSTGGAGGNGANVHPIAFSSGDGARGGHAWGGGLFGSATTYVTNCTFALGRAAGGAGGLGGTNGLPGDNGSAGASQGGNIARSAGSFVIRNSIFDEPFTGNNNGFGTITDSGYNLSSDASIPMSATGSAINTSSSLQALADNGGPTKTRGLQSTSPAKDRVTAGGSCLPTDQRGYFRVGACDSGAFEYNGYPPVPVSIMPNGPVATEDGVVGIFSIHRSASLQAALNVSYAISGSASNGQDYVTITGSVTIPANTLHARVLIRGLPDGLTETNETITLTLLPAPDLVLTAGSDTATVTLSDYNTFDASSRFVRGTASDPSYHSFVIPLDFQKGVRLDDSGGNATNLFPGNIWTTTHYHFNASNAASQATLANRIAYQNPIVAFGSQAGANPLYVGQPYSFGLHGGDPTPNFIDSTRVRVYYRTNWGLAGTLNFSAVSYTTYLQNGMSQTVEGFGLKTVMMKLPYLRWDVRHEHTFTFTHTASTTATNYFFVVEQQGKGLFDEALALDGGSTNVWSKLYVLNFTARPQGLPIFVDQPHFQGKPLPREYQGKTLRELTNVVPTMPNLSGLTHSNYLTLNDSPELRRHPILDRFVSDMSSDPLALANYVINEIELTDAMDYDTNRNQQAAIYLGGVNRGALATFQEGKGSPLEQCALLVYLLRQAGVPAAYVFPTNNGLQMLDFQLSKLLRVQIRGAKSSLGQTNLPELIPVNYPWVAAYLTNESRWVQVFPWLKDTEIVEGLDVYDYFPTNYNSGRKWLVRFCLGDTNLIPPNASSDQPFELLPQFIQKQLDANAPGLSVDDMGMRVFDRRNHIARWDDFPKPFSLNGAPLVWESLRTNLSLFNTLQVRVYSAADTNKFVDTTEMRIADLHNRRLLLRFEQVGGTNAHDMILSLGSYSPLITNQAVFSTNADPSLKLVGTNRLNSSDDALRFQVTHRRLRMMPPGYVAPRWWETAWEFDYSESGPLSKGLISLTEAHFRKGDLVAFAFDLGRVSPRMLNVHAEEMWNFNRTADTNNPATLDKDIYQGTAAYLLAGSYFHYVDRFMEFNDRLHKVKMMSTYYHGFGLIRPQRGTNGALINNGVVNLIEPAVHMPHNALGLVFNATMRPDSGRDFVSGFQDWWFQGLLQSSAAEHGALKSFYRTNAISTVKLLQQVGTNMLRLNVENYVALGETFYNGTKLKDHDTTAWQGILALFESVGYDGEVLMTPGTVTNGSYKGVGAFLISSAIGEALVSGLNGGFAQQFPTITFSEQNANNLFPVANAPGEVSTVFLNTSATANNSGFLVDGAPANYQHPGMYNQVLNNQVSLNPALSQGFAYLNTILGIPGGTMADGYLNAYDTDAYSTTLPYYPGAPLLADPVHVISGEFYIDANDLSLPGPMPLHVRRNYGSQNLTENEFGFGWKINYVPFLTVNNDGTLIFAAEMDGSVITYRQQTTNLNVFLPATADNPSLNNNSREGSGVVFNLFNNRLILSTPGGTNTYTLTGADGSVRTYTTRSYPIGSFNRTRPYLDKWQDRLGNFYTFQYGTDSTHPDYGQLRRVQSSGGTSLGFYYDIYGHIIEAYTGDGRRLKYEYDKYGDLIKVTLPDQSEINYDYQQLTFTTNGATHTYSTHLILREFKPDGRILQNDYDSQRRVTAQYATVGPDLRLIRNATFVYSNNFSLSATTNLVTGKTEVYDYTNRLTTYFYTNGLMRRIVDPLNQAEIQDWYEADTADGGYRRSLKSQTDERNLVTTWKYDSKGNPTNIVVQGDLTGEAQNNQQAVSTFSYDANNLPLVSLNASGTTNKYFYTNTWLPSRIEIYPLNASGANVVTNSFVYYNVTNPLNSAQFSMGLRKRQVRAEGSADAAIAESLHDYRGFETNVVLFTGTTDPNVTNHFLYNARGELVEQRDGAGRRTRFDYDALGRPKYRETYEAGQSTPLAWEYSYFNANGELVWTDGPRFDPDDYVYLDRDGAGRVTTQLRWRSQAKTDGSGVEAVSGNDLFAIAFSEYDPLNNLKRTIDPGGVVVTNSYDALSQLLGRKVLETNGTVLTSEGFAREPGGQPSFYTNALGGFTEIQYTWRGQKRFQRNSDGSTNGWTYYLDGRPKREIQGNGAYWEISYDDANRRVTRTFKRPDNTALATLIEESDRRGNIIRRVDAASNAFTNKYDGLNRLKWQAGPVITYLLPPGAPPHPGGPPPPDQQATTNYFDAVGLVETNINAVGDKTITHFDALRRATRLEIRNAANGLVRETSWSYSANHQSVTLTNGSGASAIASTTFTDTFGNPVLDIAYPSSGVRHFARRRFDAVGNALAEIQASVTNSALVEWTTTSFAYDGLGRAVWQSQGDGAVTTYAFDAAGNETNRLMPGGLIWRGRYNTAGQITNEFNLGTGDIGTRTNTYAYFGSASPFAGLLQTHTDGRGKTCTYSYDDWLRQASAVHSGTSGEQNLTNLWQYDARGLLTNIFENFTSSASGPSTRILRNYDSYGQLKDETITIGGTQFGGGMMQSWDSAGRRRSVGYGYGQFGFNLSWRADGTLGSFQGPTGTGHYGYTTAGYLSSRNISNQLGARITTILQRDGAGHALAISNSVNGVSRLVENLAWTGDGLPATHTLARADFTDSRQYSYASLTRRLIDERLNLDATRRYTNTVTYDSGQPGKDGVPTRIGQPEASGTAWKGGMDAFARITAETNNVAQQSAWGNVNGSATVSVAVDGTKMPVALLGTNGGQWRATLELTPGPHQIVASAFHPSGQYTASATNHFTNSIGSLTATDTVDGAGNVTQKLWKNPNGTTNRTQTLVWDARNRLVVVIERDSTQSGRNWSATYDALNRLLRTTDVPVTNGVTNVTFSMIVDHYYDPQHEFLEVGVSENGAKTWKVLGPDTDGVYGGQNGTGGFEAIVPGPELFCPLLSDAFGNLYAVFDQKHSMLMWYPSRLTGYGAVPGYSPVPLGQKDAELGSKCAYRNRAYQSIGFIWMGDNMYDPVSAQFLRHDALGHDSSPNGRTPFSGNPYFFWDADGRLAAANARRRTSLAGNYSGYISDDPTDSWQYLLSQRMTARTSDFDPFAYTGPSLGARAGEFGRAAVNADLVQQSWYELRHPDFGTRVGRATFVVAGVGLIAGVIDAAFNVIPGKATLQNAVKTGVREVVEVGAKETVQAGAKEAIETTAKTEANVTRLGVTRNNPADWRATRDLWDQSGYADILSEANRAAIARGRTPVVDETWIRYFSEDAGLIGERISMHHIQGTPLTVPLPFSRHRDAHLPGGFANNPGGPGSALPVYPRRTGN